jgi:hypothetical protein
MWLSIRSYSLRLVPSLILGLILGFMRFQGDFIKYANKKPPAFKALTVYLTMTQR